MWVTEPEKEKRKKREREKEKHASCFVMKQSALTEGRGNKI